MEGSLRGDSPGGSSQRTPPRDSHAENLNFHLYVVKRLILKPCEVDPACRAVNFGTTISKMVGRKLSYDHFLVGLQSTQRDPPSTAVVRYAVYRAPLLSSEVNMR